MLTKYAGEEEVDENTSIPDRKVRKRKCEQRWTEEVQSKKQCCFSYHSSHIISFSLNK